MVEIYHISWTKQASASCKILHALLLGASSATTNPILLVTSAIQIKLVKTVLVRVRLTKCSGKKKMTVSVCKATFLIHLHPVLCCSLDTKACSSLKVGNWHSVQSVVRGVPPLKLASTACKHSTCLMMESVRSVLPTVDPVLLLLV